MVEKKRKRPMEFRGVADGEVKLLGETMYVTGSETQFRARHHPIAFSLPSGWPVPCCFHVFQLWLGQSLPRTRSSGSFHTFQQSFFFFFLRPLNVFILLH